MRNELEELLLTNPNLLFIGDLPGKEELESAFEIDARLIAVLKLLAILVKKIHFRDKLGVHVGDLFYGLVSPLIYDSLKLPTMKSGGKCLNDDFVRFKFINLFLDILVFFQGHGDRLVLGIHKLLLKDEVGAAVMADDMIALGSSEGNVRLVYPVVIGQFHASNGIVAIVVWIGPDEIAFCGSTPSFG